MTESMHELSATDRAILTAFREHESPPPGAAQRVYLAALARITDEDEGPAPIPPIPWLRSIALSVAIAAAVLLAMRGVVTGARALREDARATPGQAALGVSDDTETSGEAQVAKPPKPARSTAAPPATEAAQAPVVVPEPPAPTPDPAAARPPRSRGAAADASDLAADLELLAEAKRTADPTPRLQLLSRHAKAHPRSTLAEERDVLIIETLCALGRSADARARATAFAERRPASAFHARVSKSCAAHGP